MRYTVGQKYYFINIDIESNNSFFGLYKPWEDTIKKVDIVVAECIEHCKVTNGYSDEKDCDGFIFTTVNNGETLQWYNQYPTASYGQLSTDNDWYIRPAILKSDDAFSRYEDITIFLDRIQRGITHFSKEQNEPVILRSLQIFYTELLDYLYLTHNVGVVNTPFIAEYADNRFPQPIPEIRNNNIVPLDNSPLSNVVWSEEQLTQFHTQLIERLNNIKKK